MSVLFEKVPEQAKVPGQARDDGMAVIPAKAGNQRNINTIRANTNSPTLTSQTIAFEGIKCCT
ncbi:hypothetical protein [Marisediminitalea sp.]|uniref:hypothetical protein n=1 Tax=Marisediminitalea sp. TaxID=2662268 RepID=UPI0035179AC4